MTAPIRQPAENATVFTVGGTNFIGDLENATVTIEIKDEDASASRDIDEYAWAVKRRYQIEGDLFVGASAAMMVAAGNSVALVFTTGGMSYSGQFLVTQGVHSHNKAALDKQKAIFKNQGPVTLTPPGS